MEDDLWWRTTFDGRRPCMKGNLGWKTTLDGRQPLIKKKGPLMKDKLDGRLALLEDDL